MLSELNTALGAYYRKHAPTIDSLLVQDFASRSTYKLIPGVKDQYVSKLKHLDKFLQPGQRGFTPHTAKLRVIPEINTVEPVKGDYEITKDDYRDFEKSALSPLTDGAGSANNQITAGMANLVFNAILDRKGDEMERMHEKAVKVAPTHPTPGDALDSFDGLEKKEDDAIADGKLLPIAIGDYDETQCLDVVEEFVKTLPHHIRTNFRLDIDVSPWFHLNYWINRRTKFGLNMDYNPDAPLFILNYKNIVLRPIPGMNASKRIKATVPGNKLMLADDAGEENRLNIVLKEDERAIRIVADMKVGFGYATFGIPGSGRLADYLVFVNDVK